MPSAIDSSIAPPLEAGRPPPPGELFPADALVEPWFSCLHERLGGARIFDCHTHLGCADPDGSCFDVDELMSALTAVDGRAVVFPLAEPDGYRVANDRILAAANASAGRLVAFCRVDPRDGAAREVERAVGRGAAGIKLHPRAERFGLGDPAVGGILAVADERRLPVIVHAGRGIPSLGRDAVALAGAYPRVPLILAHAAIADLGWIWREAAGTPNLFFDTAWWNIADQLALFTLVPPAQILFASDTPYGRTVAAASVALRAGLAAGLGAEQIAMVAGGQLERLLAGAEPLDLGPASTTPPSGPGPLLERIYTLLIAAAARLSAAYPAEEYLDLARLACAVPGDHPDAMVSASVRELLDRHARYLATDPPRRGPRVPGVHLIFVAAAVARTPGLPLPALQTARSGCSRSAATKSSPRPPARSADGSKPWSSVTPVTAASLRRMDSEVWDRRYAGRELVWTSEANRFLIQEVDGLAPGRALDLACGEGRNAVWLAERGWKVTGVDFSKVGLEKARQLEDARGVHAEWIASDLLSFRPAPESFELVIVFYLQVPEAQRTPILKTAASAVAPGGTLLLVGHDSSNIAEGHGGPQEPAVLYTAEDIGRDLEGTGLRIERAERVRRPVQTPEGDRIAFDALVRAART